MSGLPLVTGATGFAGSHLVDHLLEHHPRVAAWSNPNGRGLRRDDDRVEWAAVDLLDAAAVAGAIASLTPSAIYHCAGVADVAGSWHQPAHALKVNALGTHHVLEAVRRAGLQCPVLITGSALVYRTSTEPLDESSPIGPANPYGFSKLSQEMVATGATDCRAFIARPFNHAGPRQSTAYVTSRFAYQIAAIEAGLRKPVLHVGNLDSRRDITDVRDTVRAYRLIVDSGAPHRPYNVCSGTAQRIGDLLELLVGLARVPIEIEVDPALLRPADNPIVLGHFGRLEAECHWRPSIPIEQTLGDLLEYWRERTAAEP